MKTIFDLDELQVMTGLNFVRSIQNNAPLPHPIGESEQHDAANAYHQSRVLFEAVGKLILERDALEAARLQYKASMERYERLGRACLKWAASMPKDRLFGIADLDLHGAIQEWMAGEPKDAREAT